ncbi:MAG: GHMP kinase [Bacteroidetes bacterium]|nr:MAG: GHMP kinase [Bacteroidota bacterium]
MNHSNHYHAKGKLLLFGEYFVLDGVPGLAVPSQRGQSLVTSSDAVQVKGLYWKSLNLKDEIWFEAYFDEHFGLLHGLQDETAITLQKILQAARQLNPNFLKDGLYHEAITKLEFAQDSGLGSSSTLIHLIAQWAQVDAMQLFFLSFPGSGYDIACAGAEGPILYRKTGQSANWETKQLNWPWEQILFVHLGQKQNSREGIQRYRERSEMLYTEREAMTQLVLEATKKQSAADLAKLMQESEALIAQALGLSTVQAARFSDFSGSIKSLGAWGGDYVMALGDSKESMKAYFLAKGLDRFLEASDLMR